MVRFDLPLEILTNDKLEAARTGTRFIGTLTEHSANGGKKEGDRDLAGKDLSGADFVEANLTYLDLTGNQLTELPPEIRNLTQLTLLGLNDNQLTELPPR